MIDTMEDAWRCGRFCLIAVLAFPVSIVWFICRWGAEALEKLLAYLFELAVR